ncbi:MAG TPA: Fur family transcriptional regulator [Coriobacteriia bacterium]
MARQEGTPYRGRSSSQRDAIAQAAEAMPGAFSAEELLGSVRQREPGVGAATVYRALKAMRDAGFVEAVGTREGAVVYARCRGTGHHHHLVCTACGAVAEADCELDRVLERVASASGYTVTSHELALRGVCPACRKKGA